ncbi:MAG: AfsR/SARP family transcriptional regulator, partial [Rudaea sp.]
MRYRPVNPRACRSEQGRRRPVANLTLGFLGSLQIAVAGAPISTFESDKSRALLAYLAVESRQPHRRDALVGLLWPESSEETARRNLRQALYNLRNAIGDHAADPPYLLISRDEIQFNRHSDHSLDVADFDAGLAAAEAHSHPASEACDICAPLLKKAAALYRGKFLQEFFLQDSAEFEEWALVQRESLHRRAVQALVRLANYHEQRGEYEQARVFALRQIELEPWSEEAHRQVMRLLVAAGQRSGALAQYETCRRILTKELGVEPSAETRELYEQIRRGEVSAPKPAAPARAVWSPPPLPLAPTPFLGREKELGELARLLLAPECRLLTLVGPGGIGKTRLALEAATNLRERFRDGAAFVSLAGVENPAFIIATLADAIGFTFSGPADNTTQLVNHLHDKQVLLVLDNVEHLLAADQPAASSAGVLSEILERAPGVKLLVTSRELLDLQQEWLFQVGGLQLPEAETGDQVERSSAAALFLQRARRAQVGFQLEPNDRPALARICNLVGGTPLGLELAAAWVRTLSLDEIQHEIERSLDFLETSMRDLPERHRSMRAVFDHSWLLLSEQERTVLRRLSVFRGGFRREAAEQIAGATLSLLSTLQSKSLLRRVPGGRYDLHELVLQYADAKLAESPDELRATRERHSRYFLDFVQAREKDLKSARQLEALKEMSEESGNLRPAWRHAIQFGWASAMGKQLEAYWIYYEMRGGLREAKVLLGKAVDALQQRCAGDGACDEDWEITLESVRAQEAWFCIKLGEVEEARELLGLSVPRLEALGAFKELVRPVHYKWALAFVMGDL